MTRWLTSLAIRELQITTTGKDHLTPTKRAMIKKITRVGGNLEKL